ncbi:MAG: hypothetical protein V2A66_01150 [Pseudomonadota bacterium]
MSVNGVQPIATYDGTNPATFSPNDPGTVAGGKPADKKTSPVAGSQAMMKEALGWAFGKATQQIGMNLQPPFNGTPQAPANQQVAKEKEGGNDKAKPGITIGTAPEKEPASPKGAPSDDKAAPAEPPYIAPGGEEIVNPNGPAPYAKDVMASIPATQPAGELAQITADNHTLAEVTPDPDAAFFATLLGPQ